MGKQSRIRNDRRQAKQPPETSHQPAQVQQPKPLPNKKRITFDVDPELHAKAFIHARRRGTTIKDLLTAFLERETVNEKI
jgi:hypothetical protein